MGGDLLDDESLAAMREERENLPSASPWRRFELCQGSWQLEQKARELGQLAHKESIAAASGERIHAFLAGALPPDITATEAQTAQFLDERSKGEAERIFAEQSYEILTEGRLWLFPNNHQLSGRFDRLYIAGKRALLQDFKSGFSEPDPAEQNAQLKVLAVLAGINYPQLEEIIVQIISGPYGVTEARYDLKALTRAYDDIRGTLAAIGAPGAPLSPSPEACRYCPAINICSAVRELAKPLTRLQIAKLPTGQQAAKLLDQISIVRNLFTEIEDYYFEQLSGDPDYDLPGYALAPGNTVRKVSDWATAHSRLSEFLETSEIWGCAAYRLTDLEKLLAKKLKLRASEAKSKINEILHGLIEERPNRPSLKRVRGETLVSRKDLLT
jgi:Protein of unknown function (DUF2800)